MLTFEYTRHFDVVHNCFFVVMDKVIVSQGSKIIGTRLDKIKSMQMHD